MIEPPKIKWEEYEYTYGAGENGFLGKYPIFQIFWNSVDSKNGKYILTCKLPGIKNNIYAESVEKAKGIAQYCVDIWFKNVFKVRRKRTK